MALAGLPRPPVARANLIRRPVSVSGQLAPRPLAQRVACASLRTAAPRLGARQQSWSGSPACSSSRHGRLERLTARSRLSVDNRELLMGDCLLLVAFCMYKQITALILHPAFPGWLAPLKFNLTRFEELASFATTLVLSWTIASLLVGGYRVTATANLPTALSRVSWAWLVSMPVAACQLVLVTAAEDRSLVGGELFASALPLAASGPGEPLATAAGVLGLMAVWRCFYALFLDVFNADHWSDLSRRLNRHQDVQHFLEALRAAFLLSISGVVLLQFLAHSLGEEGLRSLLAAAGWRLR